MAATLNYIVTRTGTLVATSGQVTVTPAQGDMFWAIGTTDTPPVLEAKHSAQAGNDKSFNLDTGERLFLFKIGVESSDHYVAVTADNPASGNV